MSRADQLVDAGNPTMKLRTDGCSVGVNASDRVFEPGAGLISCRLRIALIGAMCATSSRSF